MRTTSTRKRPRPKNVGPTWKEKAAYARLALEAAQEAADKAPEIERCRADVAYFINNYVVIDEVLDDAASTRPFHLWPDQSATLLQMVAHRLIVFLKARQLGITWLCLAFALWLMLFWPGKVVILISQGQNEADEMNRRIKAMYERLPGWMKAALPARVKDNTSEQGWANDSRCESLPATERAGRSLTASLVISDEAAHQKWGRKLYAACKPTIDAGGKLFVVSSANGADGFFDKLWKKAFSGKGNGFLPIFLSWRCRPDRDQAFIDRQIEESTDPELVKQEYPDNPTEAFVASGRVRFRQSWLVQQEPYIQEPTPEALVPGPLRFMDGLAYYAPPRSGLTYVVVADVAEGKEAGDNDAAVVACLETGEEMASLHGKWDQDRYAVALFRLACFYDAPIAVERNNHGHAVILRLGQLVGGELMPAGLLDPYAGRVPRRVWIYEAEDGYRGWITTNKSKPLAVDSLAESLRDLTIYLRTRAALLELGDYSVLANGKTGASPGNHDDFVTAWFIFCGVRDALIGFDGRVAF